MKIKSLFILVLIFPVLSLAQGFLPVANISKISGTVYLNKEAVKVGQEVAEGMTISTPKKGDFIDVKFQNGHIVRMVGAEVKVTTLNPKNTLFELVKGKIFSQIKSLTTNETFHIKTKMVSFAVKGTQFMVEEDKKQTYLCVREGIVTAKMGKQSIEVNKDEDMLMAPGRQFKATLAAKSMIKMTQGTFNLMNEE